MPTVSEVTELCRTQADIKPMLDRTLVASQITEIYTKSSLSSFGVERICGQIKNQSLSRKIFPQIGFRATVLFFF